MLMEIITYFSALEVQSIPPWPQKPALSGDLRPSIIVYTAGQKIKLSFI
jgi:hypothetical protein